VEAIEAKLSGGPLQGLHVLMTSGPTHEPIDPVRYIANRSSGRQGSAIGAALARAGAEVTFVTGPAEAPAPSGCKIVPVETAAQMRDAVADALPADIAIFAAAVADWRVKSAASGKIKKDGSGKPPTLTMAENPDILAEVSALKPGKRPRLVIGFAAETDDVLAHARAKRERKRCDWLIANDVSPASGVMGGTENEIVLLTSSGEETWPRASKDEVAAKLIDRIARWRATEDEVATC
ncbi:MAG: phosphopantothenoylcysteine decarboxylase, partial [Pseudomonadota bacterium]